MCGLNPNLLNGRLQVVFGLLRCWFFKLGDVDATLLDLHDVYITCATLEWALCLCGGNHGTNVLFMDNVDVFYWVYRSGF